MQGNRSRHSRIYHYTNGKNKNIYLWLTGVLEVIKKLTELRQVHNTDNSTWQTQPKHQPDSKLNKQQEALWPTYLTRPLGASGNKSTAAQ